jgi:hypothetical protein
MSAQETVLGNVTAPGATVTATAPAAGNSFTVRSFTQQGNPPPKAHLVTAWLKTQGVNPGILRIRSPRLHDNVQGIRLRVPSGTPFPLLPLGWGDDQILESQDTLAIEVAGSATAGQIEAALAHLFYEDLPGVSARLIDPNALRFAARNQVGNEVALNPTAGGGWTGQRAINFSFDTLKANKDYALVGITADVLSAAIRVQSADTGNLGVAVPGGITNPWLTASWFIFLSQMSGVPMIPVFNAANKGSILVDCAQDQAATAVNATLILQELN